MPKSNLRLKPDQEKNLVEYCLQELETLKADNKNRIEADRKSKEDYRNSKQYREAIGGDDNVYNFSNLSLPMTSLIVDHFCSRSEEEVTGTKPFFHFRPKGPSDHSTALGIDRYFLNRLVDTGGLKEDLEDTYHNIFTQRAAFLKATFHEEHTEWEEFDRLILYSQETGEPVSIIDASTGGLRYVLFNEEEWVQDLDIDELGEMTVPIRRLSADPTIVLSEQQYSADPGSPLFFDSPFFWSPSPEAIRFREVIYRGPKSRQVDYDCFYAPSHLPDLQDACFVAEVYDKDASWVRARWLEGEGRKTWEDYRAEIEHNSAEDETESDRNKVKKESPLFDLQTKKVKIVECWITRDVLDWGSPQRIVVYIDRDTKQAIYYEYAAVILPDRRKRHPYDAIAIWKQEDYWWGRSLPEMLEPYQEFIDRRWNSWSFRNAVNTGSIIGEHPDATVESKRLSDVKPFEAVELNNGKTMRDWLEVFTFPQTDQQTGDLIDRIFYWVQLWLGVSNIAQGDYSEVPTNTTAYGMDATLREAGRLSRRWTRRILRGFKSHIELLCMIEFATMDAQVAYKYVEGDEELLSWMTRDSVKNMQVDVELVVSQQFTQATVEANRLAEEIAVKYASYSPDMQMRVRPLFKSSLMALGHDDVDVLLPKPTREDFVRYQAEVEAGMIEGADETVQAGDPAA